MIEFCEISVISAKFRVRQFVWVKGSFETCQIVGVKGSFREVSGTLAKFRNLSVCFGEWKFRGSFGYVGEVSGNF